MSPELDHKLVRNYAPDCVNRYGNFEIMKYCGKAQCEHELLITERPASAQNRLQIKQLERITVIETSGYARTAEFEGASSTGRKLGFDKSLDYPAQSESRESFNLVTCCNTTSTTKNMIIALSAPNSRRMRMYQANFVLFLAHSKMKNRRKTFQWSSRINSPRRREHFISVV